MAITNAKNISWLFSTLIMVNSDIRLVNPNLEPEQQKSEVGVCANSIRIMRCGWAERGEDNRE